MPRRIPEETKQRAIRLVLNHLDEYANLTEALFDIAGPHSELVGQARKALTNALF